MIYLAKSRARITWFLSVFALLMFAGPAVAQDVPASPVLTGDEVVARVMAMNAVRAKALASYSSVRTYHLECHCVAAKKADMVVRVTYRAPNQKVFEVLSESGSGTVREKVFRRLLDEEIESTQNENERRSALTPENYIFRLVRHEHVSDQEFYVLEAKPRHKNKYLFTGVLWVHATDFAVTRVEGEPAINPSWWTKKTGFTRIYEKVGDFWLPRSNDSETKLRMLGTAVLNIQYGEYRVTQAPGVPLGSSEQKVSAGQ